MRRLVSTLGSMKITVTLLLVLLVVLAAGTIIESTQSREAAAAKVYAAPWFFALLALFTLNLIASLIDRWPRDWSRAGFVITHASMIVILAGSLTTEFFKDEGQLALWEGETATTLINQSRHRPGEEINLGFTLQLDDFEVGFYPGTRRPASFTSRVTTIDPKTGEERTHTIWMNHELHWGGFKFFQSSYRIQGGREMSVLLVSRDPGQPIVFIGYGLLVLGMIIVLTTRIRQRRELPDDFFPESGPMKGPTRARPVGIGLGMVLAMVISGGADAATIDAGTLETLHALPVQHDGRVMPLDTMARESVWKVTGKHRWAGQDPVATVLGWVFEPQAWAEAPIIKIGSKDLARELGYPGRAFLSFNAALGAPGFRSLTDEGRRLASMDRPITPLQEAALNLEGRLVTMHGFLTGDALRIRPVSPDPVDPWAPVPNLRDPAELAETARELAASPPPNYPDPGRMSNEVLSNAVRPTRLAWFLLLPGTILALLDWRRDDSVVRRRLTAFLLIAGFAVMTWGLAMRWQAAGRIPASNMYESMLFLAWGVGLFAAVGALVLKNRLAVFNAAAMTTLTIMLTDLLPMDPFIHPMAPVLAGTAWLVIHVPIIMVSYALLALAALVAHMRIGVEIFKGGNAAAATAMDEVHYWYVQIGSIMLLVGIMTGSIWAASSWGRYWGWDPKEVWSLVAFLAYMAILHARFDRWMGGFGVAVASVVAFGTILMTYLGVNYVLSAGLHSYGFGASKITSSLAMVALAETIFIVLGFLAFRRNERRRVGSVPVPVTVSSPPVENGKGR